MPGFRVRIAPSALKEFDELPTHICQRFRIVFNMLQENPFRPRPGLDVLKMHGGAYRVHVGHYRGIFHHNGNDLIFFRFGHRSTVYR